MEIHSVRELAAVVRQLRLEKGWTQARLAREIGVGREWVIHLEQARAGLELGRVMSTLKALGARIGIEAWEAQEPEIDLGRILGETPEKLES